MIWKLFFSVVNCNQGRILSSIICIYLICSSASLTPTLAKYQDHKMANIKILPHIKQKHVHRILLCILINILYFKFCTLRFNITSKHFASGCLLVKPYIQLIVISVQKYKYNITFATKLL